jgi:putative transposase
LVRATLEALPVKRPRVTKKRPQPLGLDAGYDYPEVHELVAAWGVTAHIRPRRAAPEAPQRIPGYRARRWVVERTHSWMNRFRRLLIRWEKKVENYVAMLHFACAWITFRAAGVFG